MKFGIIGAGSIARTYAKLWSRSGQDVMVSSRNRSSTTKEEFGERAAICALAQAARFGEVVLIAVNYLSPADMERMAA